MHGTDSIIFYSVIFSVADFKVLILGISIILDLPSIDQNSNSVGICSVPNTDIPINSPFLTFPA